jgi:phage/plasmid primase-like uncharacterized protein
MQNLQDLMNEMQSYGLLIDINKVTYGKIGRCPTKNKPRVKNGWYRIFQRDTFIVAVFEDFQQGKRITWCSKQKLSKKDRQQAQQYITEYNEQRKIEIQQNLAKIRSRDKQFSVTVANHGYLVKKGIADIVDHKLAYPLKLDIYGNLVIPMLSANSELMGYQSIAPDGNKRFAKGSVVKSSFYPIITTRLEDIANCTTIFIGEGFATMASCYLSLNDSLGKADHKISNAYIVAYGVHMIEPVLVAIIKTFLVKNPTINIVLIADNDAPDTTNQNGGVNIGVDVCTAIKNRYQNKCKIRVFIPQLIGGHHHD